MPPTLLFQVTEVTTVQRFLTTVQRFWSFFQKITTKKHPVPLGAPQNIMRNPYFWRALKTVVAYANPSPTLELVQSDTHLLRIHQSHR